MKIEKEVMDRLELLFRESSRTIKVCVPSGDYYARPSDFTNETISFIDTDRLIQNLHELDID